MLQLQTGAGTCLPDGRHQLEMAFELSSALQHQLAMLRAPGRGMDAAEFHDNEACAAASALTVKSDLPRRDAAIRVGELS